MKIEVWNGYPIRFVWHDEEWWAVLKDVAEALGLKANWMCRRLNRVDSGNTQEEQVLTTHMVDIGSRKEGMLIINEFGIYETIFASRKKEAESFKRWVYDMLRQLRKATGLEGFQVFRMLDKEHQKEAMRTLSRSLEHPVRVDFIKSNTIANKAVSSAFGFPKMLKKDEMTPEMLAKREKVLDDTVELMGLADKYGITISIADAIYRKYH